MSDRHPVIGISGPDRGGFAAWWFASLGVRLQGGKPRRIRPGRPYKLEKLDGLIIGGGADIELDHRNMKLEISDVREAVRQTPERSWVAWLLYPLIYITRRLFSVKKPWRYDSARDQLEFSLVEAGLEAGLPMLGICRGAQLINLSLGGSLHHDITEFYEEAPLPRSIFPVKKVRICPDTHLRSIMQRESRRVNSLHHQAIEALGEDVVVSALEDNGIIQAIECVEAPFIVGVQWHPEYLPMDPTQRRLFAALVDAARNRRRQSRARKRG